MPIAFVDIKMVNQVMKLRNDNKLSFEKIAKLLEKDIKTVYRWYDYGIGRQKYIGKSMKKFSTERLDSIGKQEYT